MTTKRSNKAIFGGTRITKVTKPTQTAMIVKDLTIIPSKIESLKSFTKKTKIGVWLF